MQQQHIYGFVELSTTVVLKLDGPQGYGGVCYIHVMKLLLAWF